MKAIKMKSNCGNLNIFPYPYLFPVVSTLGEKYVRSEPNDR